MKNFYRKIIIPIIHLLVIIFLWASPWLLPWKWVIVVFILYRLELKVFKGCPLSHAQFVDQNEGFYHFYLKKIYPDIKNSTVDLFVDNILPVALITLAYLMQVRPF